MVLSLQARIRIQKILIATALTVTTLFGVAAPLTTQAAQSVPYKINFQGRLTDNNGNILSDGIYNIKFRLFDALTVGTNKWEEDRVFAASDNRITVTNGLFNIQFGDLTVFSPSLFSGVFPLFLEVELPTPATATCATNGCAVFTEGAMSPRQALASSAYAVNADTIDGIDSSSLAQLGTSNTGNLTVTGAWQSATATFTGANALALGSTTNAAAIVFNDGTLNNRAITVSAPALTGSYSLTLPTTAPSTNQCLISGPSTASQLVFGSCTGTSVSLQTAYNSSVNPELVLGSSATSGLTIRDNAAAIGANLLEVQNNSGSTTYFGVTATGISVTGTAVSSVGFTGPSFDATSPGILSVGTATATSITIGKSGVSVAIPGGITTSNGTINTGSGSITTTGALGAGAATVTSLNSGSGTIQTSGSISGGTLAGTTSLAVPLVTTASGDLTIDPVGNTIIKGSTADTTASALIVQNSSAGPLFSVRNDGAVTVSSTINSGAITSTALNAGSGTIQTTGALSGGSITGTSLTVGAGSITAGTITASVIIQPSANNTVPLGTSAAAFSNVFAANYDTGTTTTAMTIGSANATTIQFGRTGLTGSGINLLGPLSTTNTGGVVIGTADANQTNLVLDNSSTFAETASHCTISINSGALYYNTSSNAIRGCVNGSWEDVVTTGGLGLLAYGVIPDSGSNPGDLPSLVNTGVSGPCRVSWASATSYSISPCTAYSGGRKVIVAQQTNVAVVGMTATNIWAHICLTGANGQPALSATSVNENDTANMPAWSPDNPVICLTDIKGSGVLQNIAAIYDVRAFTTSQKEFVTVAGTTPGLGQLVISAGSSVSQSTATNTLTTIIGVLVALTNGAVSATAPSGIMVTEGPVYVKATTTTSGQFLQSVNTAGYTRSVALYSSTASYGSVRTSATNTCAAAATCLDSAYVNFKSH